MAMPRMREGWWFMRHAAVLDMVSGVPGPWGLEGMAPSAPHLYSSSIPAHTVCILSVCGPSCCTLLCKLYYTHTHTHPTCVHKGSFMSSPGSCRSRAELDPAPALERCRELFGWDSHPDGLLGKQQGHFWHVGRAAMQLH